ncbi:MAG: hypothetical protein ABIR33_04140 [Pyrinomonadaceae bacterium]
MRSLVASITILLSISLSIAQSPEPKLIAEFGNVGCEDWLGRMDLFLDELSNSKDRSGVVIFYEGNYINRSKRPNPLVAPVIGEGNMRANFMRQYFAHRRLDMSRIIFVSGGFRNEHLIELWSVIPGGKYPKPRPTRESIKYRKGVPSESYDSCP